MGESKMVPNKVTAKRGDLVKLVPGDKLFGNEIIETQICTRDCVAIVLTSELIFATVLTTFGIFTIMNRVKIA